MPNPCVDYFWGKEEGPGVVPLEPAPPPETKRFVVWLVRWNRPTRLRVQDLNTTMEPILWDIPAVYTQGSDGDYFQIDALNGGGAVCATWRWPQGKNARILGPDTSGVAGTVETTLNPIRVEIQNLSIEMKGLGRRLDFAPNAADMDTVKSELGTLQTNFGAHVGAGATPHDYSMDSLAVKELLVCSDSGNCFGAPLRIAWEGNALTIFAGVPGGSGNVVARVCYSGSKWRWLTD